jgi:glyoxylase-like metal-dependent hydrolase (beta-lactamase superfamily II)
VVKRVFVLAAVVAAGSLSLATAGSRGQAAPSGPTVVELQKLKDNLYLLTGGGGNSVFLVTELGVVLVDSKLAGSGKAILDTIRTVTPKPVTTIINTHSHGDHTGSNEFFPTSVEIVAQENTRLSMDRMEAFKGVKVNFLPKLMFREKMTLGSGKDRIDLFYFGPGHTGGDAWVVFPALRIMHVGDLIGDRQLPAIDFENGGSGLGYPDTLAKAAAAIKNVDTIVPGHGAPAPVKDLEQYAQLTRDFRDAVVSGYNHGLSISTIADGWKVAERSRDFTAPADRVRANVRTIVAELTKPQPQP